MNIPTIFSSSARIGFVALASLALGIEAHANIFRYSGTASGSLNGAPFSNQSFVIEITGNMASIYDVGVVTGVPAASASVRLNGGSSINITDEIAAYVNRGNNQVGFYDTTLGGLNILDLVIPGVGLDTYDMRTAFGPVSATGSGITINFPGAGVGTASGGLIFTSVSAPASFQAFVPSVPDTGSSCALAVMGMASIWMFTRRTR